MKDYWSDLGHLDHLISQYAIPFASKILGAFAIWIVGGLAVRALRKILVLTLERRQVDSTLVRYADSTLGLFLKAMLGLMILGIFGIETTSFSALLAAAGVAIGVAWSGLLSNFAAGIFLILFRPFRVGEVINAAGVTGVVREIGLFATTVDNGDNVRLFVGNNKIFSDNISNFSTNPYRSLPFKIQIPTQADAEATIQALKVPLQTIPGVDSKVLPTGEVTEVTPWVTTLVFRVACHHSVSAAVTTEGYRRLHQALRAFNYPAPILGGPIV